MDNPQAPGQSTETSLYFMSRRQGDQEGVEKQELEEMGKLENYFRAVRLGGSARVPYSGLDRPDDRQTDEG